MKMSTLRDRSKPVMFTLAAVFLFFMTGTFQTCTGETTGANRAAGCDPEVYIACSDEGNFNITVNEYYQRYENSQPYFHLRANPFGPNSQYSATDMQLDTVNALNQVWSVLINERIVNKFISELELTPPTRAKNGYENWDELRPFIKNYPQRNSTFKKELEEYGLYMVDSVFNQTLYEAAVSSGRLTEDINEGMKTYRPQLYIQIYALRDPATGEIRTDLDNKPIINPNRSRWSDWFSTIKRGLANEKLNYIINSTQSLSELELKDQLLLNEGIFNFDYLTLSMNDIEVEVTDLEIEEYYKKIKDNSDYNLKAKPSKIVEFVKWDLKGLDEDERDEIKILANQFKKEARKDWDKALINNDTYSLHLEVTLSNEFSLSGSGLSTQVLDADSSRTPLYNIIGAGRKIIEFAFNNEKGTIKRINIDSDRANGNGFNDIGVFYIKDEIDNEYLSMEEANIKDKLRNELAYKKKYEIAKENLKEILNEYSEEDFKTTDFDLLAYLADNNDNLLLMNHNGTINNFINSLISTDLRSTLMDVTDLKVFIMSLEEGFNYTVNPIDNQSVTVFRLNSRPDIESLSLTDYKTNELNRLNNTQSNLFVEDQKESANIIDNRKLVIY